MPAALLLVAALVVERGTVSADHDADDTSAGTGAAADQRSDPGQRECGPAISGFTPGAAVSARRLIGVRVTNPINEEIGEVADLIVDGCGRIDVLVVRVGGFLGFGGRRVHVPAADVRVRPLGDSDDLVVMVRDTRDHIVGNAATASRNGEDD